MELKKIRFQNFKLFKDVTFVFNKQFNIIIGNNMTGKTSILEGIMAGIKPYLKNVQAIVNLKILEQDIHQANYELCLPALIEIETKILGTETKWELGANDEGKYFSNINELSTINKKINKLVHEKEVLPLFAYYPVSKVLNEKKFEPVTIDSRLISYKNSHNAVKDYAKVFNWLITKEIKVRDKINGFQRSKLELELVKKVIISCLDLDDIFYDVEKREKMFFKLKDKRILPISALSSGYKIIFAMIGDLAVRCIQLNPYLNEKAITETNGLVLIDEIDQHLHPILQQQIVGILRNTFPKLQFIVTTHSPHVIASAEAGEVIILPNIEDFEELGGEISPEQKSYKGWQLDYILKDIMYMLDQDESWYHKIVNPILDEIDEAFKQKNVDNFDKGVEKLKVILSPSDPILASLEIQKIRLKLK
ncbi:MAG: hypothetical protein EAZ97_08280 [Bacteroidetes bacterium]|nr:MAG: hypothetical protein EAZ97_08280 [Bacteroidota bacterium]